MISKTYVQSREVWKVKFGFPPEEFPQGVEVLNVHLVGDFNEWAHEATPMTLHEGVYSVTLELLPGHDHQFRYLVNGEIWCNDWEADAYEPNVYGQDNCVIILPES
jgi:hypothetical protein